MTTVIIAAMLVSLGVGIIGAVNIERRNRLRWIAAFTLRMDTLETRLQKLEYPTNPYPEKPL